ncbi:hypothetical protein [Sedimentibacter sp.]|uniref:hypothetical protein n=1 Tax=Sedimentibacter sp. TaxID=1960295 RepID=UPI0028A02C8E|nr:hypothetical protein [Sedimentibacter sp.]
MKFDNKSANWKYISITILFSIILFSLFYYRIKTYALISVIVQTIPAYIFYYADKNKIDTKALNTVFVILLCTLLLSYSSDYIYDIYSHVDDKADKKVHLAVATIPVENKEEEIEGNYYLSERNISQDTTTSVRYITPTQLEDQVMHEKSTYIPSVDDKIISKILFLSTTFNAYISNVSEYHSKSVEVVKEKLERALHIEDGYPISELNGNQEVVQLLTEANEIDLLIKKDNTVENNIKLMNKYHEAYELAPCSSISLQLARPYEEIILIYPRDSYGECNRIIEYGAKGIEYFLQTLAYKEASLSTDGDIMYRIAKIYHYLGDLPNLDIKYRTEFYKISSAYFELSILLKDEEDYYKEYKPYYAAMVNHKLGVLSNEDNDFYLLRALDFYQQSLLYNDIKEQMYSDANLFSSEICNRLIKYINTYGQKDGMKSIEEYEELDVKYIKRCKY